MWSYVLAGLGILSIYLTGKKLRSGWVVGLINSGLWAVYALTSANYGFLISSAFFIAIQTKNLVAWSKR